jgi:deoxyribodipyrimidine photolyase-related protein
MPENKILLILGNQLFPIEHIKKTKVKSVFMAEDFGLTTKHKHHKLKILMFLWSMRQYRDNLIKNGFNVYYHSIEDDNFKDDFEEKFFKIIKKENINNVKCFEVEDHFFETQLNDFIDRNNLSFEIIQSPMFITSRLEFKNFALSQKKLIRMASFYQKIRQKLRILTDENNKPIGGKWSFDEENRKKIPKNVSPPDMITFKESKYNVEIKNLINSNFDDHPGNLNDIWFPVDRTGAQKQLDNFLKVRFENFGIYEDAMLESKNFLFHSCISPFLNTGLLTPDKVINKTLQFAKKNNIPMNSVEGFIRQIIGWREFIRGIYHEEGEVQINSNYWNHSKKLTQSWYDGTTGIDPLDDCIKTTLQDGYIHHIPRLMVISNIMNLCGIDPREIYKWFMEMYIDSSDWVMVPNVFGMATYADGGMMSTKPYTCGSNYILKMSNYKKGDWCDTLDGLYWKFTEKNREFYENNPRLALLVRSLDRLEPSRKKHIFIQAENFIKQNTI